MRLSWLERRGRDVSFYPYLLRQKTGNLAEISFRAYYGLFRSETAVAKVVLAEQSDYTYFGEFEEQRSRLTGYTISRMTDFYMPAGRSDNVTSRNIEASIMVNPALENRIVTTGNFSTSLRIFGSQAAML